MGDGAMSPDARANARLMALQWALTLAMSDKIKPADIVAFARKFDAYLAAPAGERLASLRLVAPDEPKPAA